MCILAEHTKSLRMHIYCTCYLLLESFGLDIILSCTSTDVLSFHPLTSRLKLCGFSEHSLLRCFGSSLAMESVECSYLLSGMSAMRLSGWNKGSH